MNYIFKSDTVQTEYIKIRPEGFIFHSETFPNLIRVSRYFKREYKTDKYQDFIKNNKEPTISKEPEYYKMMLKIKPKPKKVVEEPAQPP